MPLSHTSKAYEQELRGLRDKLLLMGSLVEEMIGKGLEALRSRDTRLAQETMRTDRRINRLECEVDRREHTMAAEVLVDFLETNHQLPDWKSACRANLRSSRTCAEDSTELNTR